MVYFKLYIHGTGVFTVGRQYKASHKSVCNPQWECAWLRCDGQMTVSPLIAASHTQRLDTTHKHTSLPLPMEVWIAFIYSIYFQTVFK